MEQTATRFTVTTPEIGAITVTTDRDEAMADESLALLGLELPVVAQLLASLAGLDPAHRALWLGGNKDQIVSIWEVRTRDHAGQVTHHLVAVRRDVSGNISCSEGSPALRTKLAFPAAKPLAPLNRSDLVARVMPLALRDSLGQLGALRDGSSYSARLLAWLEGEV